VVPSHEIFNNPFKVNLTFEDRPTPDNYFHDAEELKLGKTIKVWPVQTKKFPEIDAGLVSNPYGLEESPDSEVISRGLNSKGPKSVALARHRNFFLWGFAASPRDMTPEARKCFVNAVSYIKKFDGQRPLVHKLWPGFTRAGELNYAYYLRTVLDEQAFKRSLPESIRNDPAQYARYRESVVRIFEKAYPAEVRSRFGQDPEKYIGWVKENLEFLHFEGEGYDAQGVIDEDVKSLRLSNRKVELLETCVSMLERGHRPELARRVLKRYTTEAFPEASQWRSWFEANRERLFFTDVGGFKFVVAPESLAKATARHWDEKPQEPTALQPVATAAALLPARVRQGESLSLAVRVKTAPGWHIYASAGSGGPGIATTLRLQLPPGIRAEGDWSSPTALRGSDGQMIHEGSFEFCRTLRVSKDTPPGAVAVACEMGYQACDERSCRAPTKVELTARAEVVTAPARP
jgi:hypothetical protein